MMLSRRIPKARPGARGSLRRNPSSSGPRCGRAAAIARTRSSAWEVRFANAVPQIPHTRLRSLHFDLKERAVGVSGHKAWRDGGNNWLDCALTQGKFSQDEASRSCQRTQPGMAVPPGALLRSEACMRSEEHEA